MNISIIKIFIIFFTTCEMVLKITKETWESLGIKTVNCYNKKTHKCKLWLKMSDIGIKLRHSNIDDFVSKRIRTYMAKT